MTHQLTERTETIGVIGAGAMGRGIAETAAAAGFRVRLFDAADGAALRAVELIQDSLSKRVRQAALTPSDVQRAVARLTLPATLGELADCDVIVEAIIEDVQAKRSLFASLESVVNEKCILATNTSSLSVTEIAAACEHPERVAGWHFFNPVPRMKLAEVIRAVRTSPQTIDRLLSLTNEFGHRAISVEDSPGFVVNHIGRAFVTEGLRLLADKCANHDVLDALLRNCGGFRMGPFELMDLTGLDVSLPASEAIFQQYYGDDRYRPAAVARIRLNGGLLGRKSGRGFYDYTSGGARIAPPDIFTGGEGKALRWSAGKGPAEPTAAVRALFEAHWPETDAETAEVIVSSPACSDLSTLASAGEANPQKVIAVDPFFSSIRGVTVMSCPATEPWVLQQVQAAFASRGVPTFAIADTPGYVAPRVIACIVNLACEIAQQGVAAPTDVDAAIRLALGHPFGPFEWADRIGPARILEVLDCVHGSTGDPRYRASSWLRRRAQLKLPLSSPEVRSTPATSISQVA